MRDASGDSNGILAAVITAAALSAIAAVGQSLFFGPYLDTTLAPLAGLLAAVALRDRIRAGSAAAVGVVTGALLASVVASPPWPAAGEWLPTVAVAAGIAGAVALGASSVIDADARVGRIFSAVCVMLVIAAMCLSVLDRVAQPIAAGGTLLTAISPSDDNMRISSDEAIFALSIRGFTERKPYYPTMRDLLVRRNSELVGSVETRVPMSYRLPTLYAFLGAMGGGGYAIVSAMLALAGLAVASAYVLCRSFVAEQFAAIGATAVAASLAGYAGGVRLLDAEFWAGMFGVVFLAAFVLAGQDGRGRAWLPISITAALLAALVRELGVAFLLVGLVASQAPGAGTRLRRAAPWLGGLAVAFAAYALHWRAAFAVIATLPQAGGPSPVSWIQPFGIPLVSAVWFTGIFMRIGLWATAVLFGLGVLGSVLGPQGVRDRVAIGLVALGGCAVSLFLGAAGDVGVGRLVPPTWGMLFVPSVLACVPLLAAVRGRRRSGADNPASEQPI